MEGVGAQGAIVNTEHSIKVGSHGTGQVDVPARGAIGTVKETGYALHVEARATEGLVDLVANLKGIESYSRADDGNHIFAACAIVALHSLQGESRDVTHGATPSRMDGRDSIVTRVVQQHGYAVGRAHTYAHTSPCRSQCISTIKRIAAVDVRHAHIVHLTWQQESVVAYAETVAKAAAAGRHMGRIITAIGIDVESAIWRMNVTACSTLGGEGCDVRRENVVCQVQGGQLGIVKLK